MIIHVAPFSVIEADVLIQDNERSLCRPMVQKPRILHQLLRQAFLEAYPVQMSGANVSFRDLIPECRPAASA
jgi:hypothetical protein